MDVTRRWRTRAAIAVMACALTLLRAAAGHAAIVVDSTTSASAHGQHPHVVPHRRRRPEARPGRRRDQPRWEQDRDGGDLRWNAPHAHRLSERTRKREPRRDLVPGRAFPRHGQRRRQPLGIGGRGRRRDLVQRRESDHAVRHLRVGPGDERVAKRDCLERGRAGRARYSRHPRGCGSASASAGQTVRGGFDLFSTPRGIGESLGDGGFFEVAPCRLTIRPRGADDVSPRRGPRPARTSASAASSRFLMGAGCQGRA